MALYRSGDWAGATKALSESIRLGQGGSSADFFFLAMAHARLGDSAEARAWYAKGVGWMSKNAPRDAELIRFRAEAAELLGLVAPPPRLKSP